eukprot:CAMPEP_0185592698 /NCGR_PEP_ID=MMETSP0434-20130131/68807_1 /TAXON_ID=626734 ORGANISM="Favella taraikaensis, Strain Fe Narragansett Bay" /NCGR_SAMPLE_ID=MMETSP0434 /ASSEMBLY_ACC=CAM_ASM_000379 /LENGTH=63 /DNA_ID=CAMNT_0028218693 /DNA_START=134 /DNA_END=322 /DNA_ORIENTATION=-
MKTLNDQERMRLSQVTAGQMSSLVNQSGPIEPETYSQQEQIEALCYAKQQQAPNMSFKQNNLH